MGILSDETEKLIEAHASRRGETPDSMVRRLLGEAVARKPDTDAIMRIARRSAALPLLDPRDWRSIRDEAWGG